MAFLVLAFWTSLHKICNSIRQKSFFQTLDQLTLIEALHFMAFISIEAPLGAVPRGTGWVTLIGLLRRWRQRQRRHRRRRERCCRSGCDQTPRRPSTTRNVTQPVPRGTASRDCLDWNKAKSALPPTVWQKQDARAQCFCFFDDFFPSWLAGEIQYWTNARSWGAEIQTRAAPD